MWNGDPAHAAAANDDALGWPRDQERKRRLVLHDVGLKSLYQANAKSNPMAFFVGNEVYDHLEKVVDRFDDVANIMHGIVIEHV